jgi:hypothetical protein
VRSRPRQRLSLARRSEGPRQRPLEDAHFRAGPSQGHSRRHGDDKARAAVHGNRNRLKSGVGEEAMRKRGEIVERSFAHVFERGGMRHAWLRGRENIHKRYLVHVAGYNLGILTRALSGAGAPREAANVRLTFLFIIQAADTIAFVIIAASDAETAALIVAAAGEAPHQIATFSPGRYAGNQDRRRQQQDFRARRHRLDRRRSPRNRCRKAWPSAIRAATIRSNSCY